MEERTTSVREVEEEVRDGVMKLVMETPVGVCTTRIVINKEGD